MDYYSNPTPYMHPANPFANTGFMIGALIVAIIIIVAYWKIFEKAQQPGWAAIIPFYNIYVLLKVVGKPGWWLILYFIPIVNIIVNIIVEIELAKKFGYSGAFGFFLNFLLHPIGQLIIGFGKSKYKK